MPEAALSKIEFDKQTRESLARLIARHLNDELDIEIAPFDALDLLDFLSKALGPHYYNQGLQDAQSIVQSRVDSIFEAIDEIIQPTKP
jgi:uncharacterized protein (DUF2164 family)